MLINLKTAKDGSLNPSLLQRAKNMILRLCNQALSRPRLDNPFGSARVINALRSASVERLKWLQSLCDPKENHAPTFAESSAYCSSITPLLLGVLKPIVQFMGRYRNNGSHLAGLLSALYLALLLCTPWLIRESTLLLPSSASVSAQDSSGAASAAVEALRTALRARH
jgi:hypothetical protein